MSESSGIDSMIERRVKPRIEVSYPAEVCGRDSGARFRARGVADNLSAAGLYVRMNHDVKLGSRLFVVLRFSTQPVEQVQAPAVAALGIVVRTDSRADGTLGVAVKFRKNRVL
jgi:hypothetical protein